MDQQTKTCQNCKNNFTIEPEDFVFYEKIKVPSSAQGSGMAMPAPTFCPECRMKRRMIWRNERSLYKRKCDTHGHDEEIISMYAPEVVMKVYDQKSWQSDNWDPIEFGKEYNFNKPFFPQFHDLLKEVPAPNLNGDGNSDCHFVNWTHNSKGCYLVFGGSGQENISYANQTIDSKDSMDLYTVGKMELSYDNVFCQGCYRLFFGQSCENCVNSYFLYDCKNCQNCFGCVGLRNKQYYIFNKSYSKEEYEKIIKGFELGTFKGASEQREKFKNFKLQFPHKFANVLKANNSTGDNIIDAQNCKSVFDIVAGGTEDSKYSFRIGKNSKDVYDCSSYLNCELLYENFSVGANVYKILFSVFAWNGHDIQYSLNCHYCNNLFGCIGLRNKQYCILNKQYTKEEYMDLVPRIIKHMEEIPYIDKKGRIYKYGEFFPSELSPFAYNETIAQEYFPLTKEQAIEQGYNWKDPEERNIKITMTTDQIPDHIKDVPDSIVNEIIQCAHAVPQISADDTQINTDNQSNSASNQLKSACMEQCTTAFKIIPQELEFYRKMNLPLPRLCPNCRHYQRIKQRNPLKLWKRKCMCQNNQQPTTNDQQQNQKNNLSIHQYKNTATHQHGETPCPNEFETTYSPERPEIVYCEQCYNAEVA